MPLVSVVIPCFNAVPWIRETLQSVLEQEIDDMEVIVVDDGSTDNSVEIIEKEFPRVHLIMQKTQGPSKARNIGTKESKGEFIQYLDADDLLAPGKLKLQLETLKRSGADIAYGDWQRLVKTEDGKFEKGEEIRRTLQNPEIDLFTTDFWCPLAAYLFRRSIIQKVGGWKEHLPVIQDVRFDLDCALYGGTFIYTRGIAAYYRTHSTDSVSTRDPAGKIRDCLLNAAEIEKWWEGHGGITQERKAALLKAYGYVARSSFEKDKPVFETAYQAIERLGPNYIPEGSRYLKLAARLFGYRNAETLALYFRKAKGFFRKN